MKIAICDFSRADKSPAIMEEKLTKLIESTPGSFRSALLSENAATGRFVFSLIFADKIKSDEPKVKVKVIREPMLHNLQQKLNDIFEEKINIKVILQSLSAKSNNLFMILFYEEK
jgi:hypothetical protein